LSDLDRLQYRVLAGLYLLCRIS